MRWVLLALIGFFGVIDTTLLSVNRSHPADSVLYPTPDADVSYAVVQVEASALKPFCLSIDRSPKRLWAECYHAGSVRREIPAVYQSGSNGEALSLTLRSPVGDDAEMLSVIVRMVVNEVPVLKPDGGHP